ncbi:hypothetical protein R6Q57_024718 [Mikania cordata]
MFLAGNRQFVALADSPQPRTQAQGPTPMAPNTTQPCSSVSSPVSVSSHRVDQLTGGPPNETEAAKRIMSSLGQAMQSGGLFLSGSLVIYLALKSYFLVLMFGL